MATSLGVICHHHLSPCLYQWHPSCFSCFYPYLSWSLFVRQKLEQSFKNIRQFISFSDQNSPITTTSYITCGPQCKMKMWGSFFKLYCEIQDDSNSRALNQAWGPYECGTPCSYTRRMPIKQCSSPAASILTLGGFHPHSQDIGDLMDHITNSFLLSSL